MLTKPECAFLFFSLEKNTCVLLKAGRILETCCLLQQRGITEEQTELQAI